MQIRKRELRLFRRPRFRFRRSGVFEPPVRIGDLLRSVRVDDIALFRGRIGELLLGDERCGESHGESGCKNESNHVGTLWVEPGVKAVARAVQRNCTVPDRVTRI